MSKFKTGETVHYTNGNGIPMGTRTIIGIEEPEGEETRYFIDPTDTPWYSIREHQLRKVEGDNHEP